MSPLDHLVPLINAHAGQFAQPGVLAIRPGYKTEDHWPTQQPAIVVTVSAHADTSRLPNRIGNTSVEIRPADAIDQLRFADPATYRSIATRNQEFRSGAFPEVDVAAGARELAFPHVGALSVAAADAGAQKTQIPYTPADVPLTPVAGKVSLLCHASPDAGWPALRTFLHGTQHTLTAGMYDFTSAHILHAVTSDLKHKHSLRLVLDHPAKNPTADQTDTETVAALAGALGREFRQAWALVESNNALAKYIYPSAYHIKVAVRDSSATWLSSGNWNNSNQPDIDPIGHPAPNDQAVAAKSDRDWHVIIDHPGIAKQFEAYLRHDLSVARAAETPAATFAAQPPVTIPLALETAAQGTFVFHPPLLISGEQLTVTPLLTPDANSYHPHMLNLLQSARSRLYIQLQYIHPPQSGVDADFQALIDAVIARIHAGVDVRIICSQFQASGGWLERLQAIGVDLRKVRLQGGVHNKGFVVDGKKVAVGSQNWSGDGVLRNRDASVLIESATAARYYESIFLHDWDRLATQTMQPPAADGNNA